jgi:hypothetical protein
LLLAFEKRTIAELDAGSPLRGVRNDEIVVAAAADAPPSVLAVQRFVLRS